MDQNKRLTIDSMVEFQPLTDNQSLANKAYDTNVVTVLNGSAGTGKTFLGLYKALQDVLNKYTKYEKVYVVRSIVPTRDIGFLPGDEEEKKLVYEAPYVGVCSDIFQRTDAWEILKKTNRIELLTTSFIRGITLDNCIVVVDEMQNLNEHECSSIITRLGENAKIVFCGDYYQSDLKHDKERNGILKFLKVLEQLKSCEVVEFTWKDIIRSGLVRDFIMTQEMLKKNGEI